MPRIKSFHTRELTERAWRAYQRDEPAAIAVDTETSGLTWVDKPFGVTVAWDGEQHYHELGDFALDMKLHTMLASTPTLVFHNAKFDMQMLIKVHMLDRKRLHCEMFHDTETLAQLLDENRPKGLKALAKIVLGRETNEDEALAAVRRKLKLKKSDGYHVLPREVLIPYAITDARFTFDLWKEFDGQRLRRPGLEALYRQERALTLVLLDMEMAGMGVDMGYVSATIKSLGHQVLTAQAEITRLVVADDFNPNSPAQVIKAFDVLGTELKSTGVAVLSGMDHPLAEALLRLRKYSKLRGTYMLPLKAETVDGVLHPNLRQHGTRTGRMSSGGANNN